MYFFSMLIVCNTESNSLVLTLLIILEKCLSIFLAITRAATAYFLGTCAHAIFFLIKDVVMMSSHLNSAFCLFGPPPASSVNRDKVC